MPKDDHDRSRKRVHILATLGAEVHRLGLNYDDRDAFRAVLEKPLGSLLRATGTEVSDVSVGKAIADVVRSEHGPLSELGSAILHDREADAYRADCASWEAQSESVKNGKWRAKPPTRGQQLLMLRMAQASGETLPGDITSGQAHDWIAERGGNPRFSEER